MTYSYITVSITRSCLKFGIPSFSVHCRRNFSSSTKCITTPHLLAFRLSAHLFSTLLQSLSLTIDCPPAYVGQPPPGGRYHSFKITVLSAPATVRITGARRSLIPSILLFLTASAWLHSISCTVDTHTVYDFETISEASLQGLSKVESGRIDSPLCDGGLRSLIFIPVEFHYLGSIGRFVRSR